MPFYIPFHFRMWSNSEGQSEASLHPKDPAILAETEDVSMSRVMQAKIFIREEITGLFISPTMALSWCGIPLQWSARGYDMSFVLKASNQQFWLVWDPGIGFQLLFYKFTCKTVCHHKSVLDFFLGPCFITIVERRCSERGEAIYANSHIWSTSKSPTIWAAKAPLLSFS